MQQAVSPSTSIDGCKSSVEEILESYDSYIVALSMEWICQHATGVHPALLDLEIDELAQKARIKFWQVLKEKEIHYPKAYVKHIVHSEFIDMMRRHKPNVPLSEDEEGEIYRGKVLVSASKEMVDPAEVIEEQDEMNNRLEEVLKALLDLPKCQRRVMICSLRERVDDELALARALRRHNQDINQWQWPQDKQEKQRLQASLSYGRRSIAQKLKIVPVLRKHCCLSKVNNTQRAS